MADSMEVAFLKRVLAQLEQMKKANQDYRSSDDQIRAEGQTFKVLMGQAPASTRLDEDNHFANQIDLLLANTGRSLHGTGNFADYENRISDHIVSAQYNILIQKSVEQLPPANRQELYDLIMKAQQYRMQKREGQLSPVELADLQKVNDSIETFRAALNK